MLYDISLANAIAEQGVRIHFSKYDRLRKIKGQVRVQGFLGIFANIPDLVTTIYSTFLKKKHNLHKNW